MKSKILIGIFVLILFIFLGSKFAGSKTDIQPTSLPVPTDSAVISSPTPSELTNLKTFRGSVKTGASLEEIKSYCPNGLYLVSDAGTYLIGQTSMLQLRVTDIKKESVMFRDEEYINKKVEVAGIYPAQEIFCEALTCECEDYILADSVSIN